MDTSTLPAQSCSLLPLLPQPRLDILPPELLEDVVDLFPRDCIRGSLYPNRQHLRSLCLTSKRLLSFAQPALFAVIQIRSTEQAERVLRRSDLLSCCRLLNLGPDIQDLDPHSSSSKAYIEAVGRIARAATNLEALYCWGDFQIVEPFLGTSESKKFLGVSGVESDGSLSRRALSTDLKRMYLSELVLPPDTLLDLPQLEQLTLFGLLPPEDGSIQHHLPALRHLEISVLRRFDFEGPFHEFLRSLAPQLTSITADIDDVSAAQASSWTIPTLCIQYVASKGDLSLVAGRKAQIRFLELDSQYSSWSEAELDELLRLIETSGPSFPLECITIDLESSITELQPRLLEMCERRNIQVMIRKLNGRDEDSILPAFILPSFVRRAEARRAEARRSDIETGKIRK